MMFPGNSSGGKFSGGDFALDKEEKVFGRHLNEQGY